MTPARIVEAVWYLVRLKGQPKTSGNKEISALSTYLPLSKANFPLKDEREVERDGKKGRTHTSLEIDLSSVLVSSFLDDFALSLIRGVGAATGVSTGVESDMFGKGEGWWLKRTSEGRALEPKFLSRRRDEGESLPSNGFDGQTFVFSSPAAHSIHRWTRVLALHHRQRPTRNIEEQGGPRIPNLFPWETQRESC